MSSEFTMASFSHRFLLSFLHQDFRFFLHIFDFYQDLRFYFFFYFYQIWYFFYLWFEILHYWCCYICEWLWMQKDLFHVVFLDECRMQENVWLDSFNLQFLSKTKRQSITLWPQKRLLVFKEPREMGEKQGQSVPLEIHLTRGKSFSELEPRL